MKTFLSKIKRMPVTAKVIVVSLVVGLVLLSYFIPYWLEFAIMLPLLWLFCPNFNVLGGGCSSTTTAQYVFGWLMLAAAGYIVYLLLVRLHAWWQRL